MRPGLWIVGGLLATGGACMAVPVSLAVLVASSCQPPPAAAGPSPSASPAPSPSPREDPTPPYCPVGVQGAPGQPGGVVTVQGMACPLPGSEFTDSWWAARPGGRVHRGVDMFAPRGTPVLAPEAGKAVPGTARLGGLVVRLSGESGTYHFLAHLRGYALPVARPVEAGDVVGYVGTSGNAAGTAPHLHWQLHPGGRGSSPVNPYPVAAALCRGSGGG